MISHRMIRKLRRVLFWLVMFLWISTIVCYWSYVAVSYVRSSQDSVHSDVVKRDSPVTEAPEVKCKPVECNCETSKREEKEVDQPIKPATEKPPMPKTNYPLVELKSYIPNFYTKLPDSEKHRVNQNTSIVFVHGQKASATMKGCLRLVQKSLPYAAAAPEVVYDDIVAQFYRDHAGPSTSLGKFYYGEATFGVCELSHGHKPCAYFTVLREPYERAASLYDFCRTEGNLKERICNLWNFKSISVTDYAKALGSHVFAHILYNPKICTGRFDNRVNEALHAVGKADKIDMSRRAFCWYRHKAFIDHHLTKEEKDKLLNYVLENLQNWFAVIGIFEEFAVSLELIENAFAAPFKKCSMWKRNPFEEKRTQQQRNDRTSFKTQLMSDRKVYEALYYDLRIYDEAMKIFHLQKAKFFSR
ncbi:uncharacterized protein [Ptychodera flava]|uniref:uncharacterized protein n=1 Tax=Ptychodera flava TaxID=63121 RepID=UPI00396A7FCB